jgi:hypothetical protein
LVTGWLGFVLTGVLFTSGCARRHEPPSARLASGAAASDSSLAPVASPSAKGDAPTVASVATAVIPTARDAEAGCLATIAALDGEPALPGVAETPERRAETFARAKAHPVIFLRAPAAVGASPEAERLRRTMFDSEDSVKALYTMYPALRKRRDLARQVLLTDGYLYAATPAFASALTNLVRLPDLFVTHELWLERGAEVRRLVRRQTGSVADYVFADGDDAGASVKLLLYDRLGTTAAALSEPLHVDVVPIAKELGFDELAVRRLGEHAVVADLRYADVWVRSALRRDGPALTLECEALAPADRARVDASRRIALRRGRVLDRLRAIMREQVEEGLPFDEPKTEVGQQDGKLRQNWVWAYRFGQSRFEFNDDHYRVFDDVGRPRVPQVCIDFITDTLERAGGSWYRPRGEPRERPPGRLDFATLGIDNERSVESFIGFAKAHPEWFDVIELEGDDRVPYAHRAEFFSNLFVHRDRYQPGDVVVIYGMRDDGLMHFHSFFVYDSDPVTGAPALVAANAGRPRVRPWEAEMLTAPLRSVRFRVRPRLEWLESVTGVTEPVARPPLPTTL